MLDQFTLPASTIWIASAPNEKGDTHVAAAFASAHHAVEFVHHTVSPGGRGWVFTIGGQTVPANAFVTPDHAFEWVLATSIYGSWAEKAARDAA